MRSVTLSAAGAATYLGKSHNTRVHGSQNKTPRARSSKAKSLWAAFFFLFRPQAASRPRGAYLNYPRVGASGGPRCAAPGNTKPTREGERHRPVSTTVITLIWVLPSLTVGWVPVGWDGSPDYRLCMVYVVCCMVYGSLRSPFSGLPLDDCFVPFIQSSEARWVASPSQGLHLAFFPLSPCALLKRTGNLLARLAVHWRPDPWRHRGIAAKDYTHHGVTASLLRRCNGHCRLQPPPPPPSLRVVEDGQTR